MKRLSSPSPNSTIALDVSVDGTVVVGQATNLTSFEQQAMIWDPISGMRPLKEVLETQLDLTGWSLRRASAVSDDGRTIVGWGINPDGVTEGWIATIPEPTSSTLLLIAGGLMGLALRTRGKRPKISYDAHN